MTCLIVAVGYGGQALAVVLEQLGDVAQAIQFCQVASVRMEHTRLAWSATLHSATCCSNATYLLLLLHTSLLLHTLGIFWCIPATALYCTHTAVHTYCHMHAATCKIPLCLNSTQH